MRLTTDSPENNVETAFNLFYIRDREVFVRGGGPAPDYKDVSLNEYTRQLIRTHAQAEDADVDDEELSMMMAEWVIEGPDTIEGLIATFYNRSMGVFGAERVSEAIRRSRRAGGRGTG